MAGSLLVLLAWLLWSFAPVAAAVEASSGDVSIVVPYCSAQQAESGSPQPAGHRSLILHFAGSAGAAVWHGGDHAAAPPASGLDLSPGAASALRPEFRPDAVPEARIAGASARGPPLSPRFDG